MADPASRTWPAIDLRRRAVGDTSDPFGDRLALLLDDLDAIAVEEDEDGLRWRIHFDRVPLRDHAATALRDSLGAEVEIHPTDVEDGGWAVRVQQELRAVPVGRLVVAPPWDVPAGPALVVVIEPSMGFGTGHHQSTRLCLEALQAQPMEGARVIDVGTGSGVLALAAARLGAREVVALDHDPDAVSAVRDNAARNGLVATLDVRQTDLAESAIESIRPGDLVLANLTAWVLRQHAGTIERLVRPGGRLVVSGFTRDQVPLVADTFARWSALARYDEDDWVALVLGRSQA